MRWEGKEGNRERGKGRERNRRGVEIKKKNSLELTTALFKILN